MQAGIAKALQKTWPRCTHRSHVQNKNVRSAHDMTKATDQRKRGRPSRRDITYAASLLSPLTLLVLTVKECDSSYLAQLLQDCGESADVF